MTKIFNAGWNKIAGLSALQGAISLTWLVYNIYLPKLLISYGFSPSLAVTLLIIENAIAVILEPLFGSLSDRASRWISTKFGLISFGVIIASAIFVLIPTMIVFREPLSAVKWIFPGVVIAWAMAMTIFRAPAISLIGKYKSADELPIVMSLLTLVGGAISGIKPVAQNFILSLGAPTAFTIASIVLLGTTAILRYFDPPIVTPSALTKRQPIVLFDIALLIGTGFGIAWGSRCLLETMPRILALYVPRSNLALITTAISLAVAISALPGGVFATKYGNRRVMLIGIGSALLALLTIVYVQSPIAMMGAILSTIICLSWVINGAVPLAISLVPTDRQGLAVGSYFGGFSAGMSSFGAVFNPVSNLTPVLGAIGGTFGLILAGVCVWQSNKLKSLQLGDRII